MLVSAAERSYSQLLCPCSLAGSLIAQSGALGSGEFQDQIRHKQVPPYGLPPIYSVLILSSPSLRGSMRIVSERPCSEANGKELRSRLAQS